MGIRLTQVDDDDGDEYEEGGFGGEDLELQPEVLQQPPVNPDYGGLPGPCVGLDGPGGGGGRRSDDPHPRAGEEAVRALPNPLPLPPSRAREQDIRHAPGGSRSRSSSRGSSSTNGGRASPPATTISQVRGDGKTHTLALQVQRAR